VRPQFTRQQYENFEIFEEHVENLIALLPSNGQTVDIQPLLFGFTLDTTTAFLFGESTYSLKSDSHAEGSKFASSFDRAQGYVAILMRVPELYWFIGGRKFWRACQFVHEFVDRIILQRHAKMENATKNTGRYVFFDAVAADSPSNDALRGQLLNILLAGRDTTACLLSWTL